MINNKVRVNAYITKDVKEKGKEICNKLGISFSGLVNVALNDYIKQETVKDIYEQLRNIGVKMQANGEKPEA